MCVLRAVNLSKRFADVTVLDDVNLDVAAGETVCLLGPNGAGKTTLMRVFLGFVLPDSGQALVQNIDASVQPVESRKFLAYVPEVVSLYPELSAIRNLSFFNAFARPEATQGELRQLLTEVGLDERFHDKKAKEFSKGMRQKIGLAIALAKQAKVVLMDEPFTGLDPESAKDLSNHVKRIVANGTSILLATHDIFHVSELASKIALLRNGHLLGTLDSASMSAYELERQYLERMQDSL